MSEKKKSVNSRIEMTPELIKKTQEAIAKLRAEAPSYDVKFQHPEIFSKPRIKGVVSYFELRNGRPIANIIVGYSTTIFGESLPIIDYGVLLPRKYVESIVGDLESPSAWKWIVGMNLEYSYRRVGTTYGKDNEHVVSLPFNNVDLWSMKLSGTSEAVLAGWTKDRNTTPAVVSTPAPANQQEVTPTAEEEVDDLPF